MAFPNNIKSSGALSVPQDLAEYFRWSCGLLGNNDANPEGWPFIIGNAASYRQFMVQDQTSNPSGINMYTQASTITRKQFYDYIDFWSNRPGTTSENRVGFFSQDINGMGLYYYDTPEPNTVWSLKQLNDWGKIKTLELMFFKSVGDDEYIPEGEGSTGNYLRDLMIMAPNWSSDDALYRLVNHLITTTQLTSSLEYLRCGLTRFEDYEGYNNDLIMPLRSAPTNVITDNNAKTLTFTPNPHFPSYHNYEHSLDMGITWTPTNSFIIDSPGEGVLVGQFLVRVAEDGIYAPSPPAANTTIIDGFAVNIGVNGQIYNSGNSEWSMSITAFPDVIMNVDLTVIFRMHIYYISGYPELIPISVLIPKGSDMGTTDMDIPYPPSDTSIESVEYDSVETIPVLVNNREPNVTIELYVHG